MCSTEETIHSESSKAAKAGSEHNMTKHLTCLPRELLLTIMELLFHPDDLTNFLSSHRLFGHLFNTYSKSVLRNLVRGFMPGCLRDVSLIIACPLRRKNEAMASRASGIRRFFNDNRKGRKEGLKTLGEYRKCWELIFKVDVCIFDWIARMKVGGRSPFGALQWPGGLQREALKGLRGLPRPNISANELLRFRLAFLRYELYCRVCYQEPNMPLIARNSRWELYADMLPAWQIEGISCVISYVVLVYYETIRRFQDEFYEHYVRAAAEEDQTNPPAGGWASIESEYPHFHPRLAYLDNSTRGALSSTTGNMAYGMASMGLDWFVEFYLLDPCQQSARFRSICNHFFGIPMIISNPFLYEFCTWPTAWEPGTIDELKAVAFYGDSTVSGDEAWFHYNQFLKEQHLDELTVGRLDSKVRIKPNSELRLYGWAIWDRQTFQEIIPNHLKPADGEEFADTLRSLNYGYSHPLRPIPTGNQLSQQTWEMLLGLYGSQCRVQEVSGTSTLFKTGKRWWYLEQADDNSLEQL